MTRTFTDTVAEVEEYLADYLLPGIDTYPYACALVFEAEPTPDGEIHLEIRGAHTRTGNPVPCTFTAPSPEIRSRDIIKLSEYIALLGGRNT